MNIDGWFDYADFYDEIAEHFDEGVFVELGVWKGKSIKYLAEKVKGKNIKVYGVDNFEGSPSLSDEEIGAHQLDEDILNNSLYATYLKNTEGLGIETIKSSTNEANLHFTDESIDFLFIDADHHYEAVKKDIELWYPKVKTGGIISGHDYAPGIGCGVIEAVNEAFFDVGKLRNIWYYIKK